MKFDLMMHANEIPIVAKRVQSVWSGGKESGSVCCEERMESKMGSLWWMWWYEPAGAE